MESSNTHSIGLSHDDDDDDSKSNSQDFLSSYHVIGTMQRALRMLLFTTTVINSFLPIWYPRQAYIAVKL